MFHSHDRIVAHAFFCYQLLCAKQVTSTALPAQVPSCILLQGPLDPYGGELSKDRDALLGGPDHKDPTTGVPSCLTVLGKARQLIN